MPATSRSTAAQWLFPVSVLQASPSLATSAYTIQRELYDRARGVEFLFRLGSSLAMPSSAMFTAAMWFHRFYMRLSLEDYHRQDVAASCLFLATKTEGCGRKLRDVAAVCQAKVTGQEFNDISPNSPEVNQILHTILHTEEVLIAALCFEFEVETPHAILVDLFEANDIDVRVQEHAWSIAHDSYRTPLCVLFTPRVIAAACYILAQHVVEGPHSTSLDARISSMTSSSSASLPTPPTHDSASPDVARYPIEFSFGSLELSQIAESSCILLQFYHAQDIDAHPYLAPLVGVLPPTTYPQPPQLYSPFSEMQTSIADHAPSASAPSQRTPSSLHGDSSPAKANGWIPVTGNPPSEKKVLR